MVWTKDVSLMLLVIANLAVFAVMTTATTSATANSAVAQGLICDPEENPDMGCRCIINSQWLPDGCYPDEVYETLHCTSDEECIEPQ